MKDRVWVRAVLRNLDVRFNGEAQTLHELYLTEHLEAARLHEIDELTGVVLLNDNCVAHYLFTLCCHD